MKASNFLKLVWVNLFSSMNSHNSETSGMFGWYVREKCSETNVILVGLGILHAQNSREIFSRRARKSVWFFEPGIVNLIRGQYHVVSRSIWKHSSYSLKCTMKPCYLYWCSNSWYAWNLRKYLKTNTKERMIELELNQHCQFEGKSLDQSSLIVLLFYLWKNSNVLELNFEKCEFIDTPPPNSNWHVYQQLDWELRESSLIHDLFFFINFEI